MNADNKTKRAQAWRPALRDSEHQLHRELDIPRIVTLCQSDLTRASRGQARARRAKLRRVEAVEGFGAELETQPLAKLEGLEERHVQAWDLVKPDGRKAEAQRAQRLRRLLDEGRQF